MSVFGHGQLRLYVLALLEDGPRHGYDIIRELENRFSGLYAPSAGTVYPRLAKLEEEGLVERNEEGRKALYSLTDAGREEAAARADEIADLQSSLDESADRMAEEMRRRVRAGAADLRSQVAEATAGLRKDDPSRASVWSATTDGATPPPFDLDGLIGGLTRGHMPDTDSIAGALRRWGLVPQTGPQDTPPGSSSTPSSSSGDDAHVPDAEEVLGEVVDEPVAGASDHGTAGAGFPSSGQVREVISILKDAGERIQQVLDQPRR